MSTSQNKAVAYYRCAEESQEAIEEQRALARMFAEKNDLQLIEEFVDNGFSGSDFNRPSWKKMMNWIPNPDIDFQFILIKDTSRIGRFQFNNYTLEAVFELTQQFGRQFIVLKNQ
jgi:site-specific DNA recombinase